MNILLVGEISYINNNLHLYDSKLHALSVIRNIEKRYHIKELEKLIKQLEV